MSQQKTPRQRSIRKIAFALCEVEEFLKELKHYPLEVLQIINNNLTTEIKRREFEKESQGMKQYIPTQHSQSGGQTPIQHAPVRAHPTVINNVDISHMPNMTLAEVQTLLNGNLVRSVKDYRDRIERNYGKKFSLRDCKFTADSYLIMYGKKTP